MKTNIYILSMLSLIFMISCKDDDPVNPTDPTDPVAVQGCTDSTATNYNADATEDDGSCTFDTGYFYQKPDLNNGPVTFEAVDGLVYGPTADADGVLDEDYEFDKDNLDGDWGAFGAKNDATAPVVSYVDNPDTNGNDSDTVLKIVKQSGSEGWSGIFFDFESALVFSAEKPSIKIDLWSPAADVRPIIKLENSEVSEDNPNFESSGDMNAVTKTTIAGGWETFVFNVPETVDFDVTRLVVLPSLSVTPEADLTYYLDNIDFSELGVAPVIGAPTNTPGVPPTSPASVVTSFFSDSYTDITGVDLNADWGTNSGSEVVSIADNNVLKLASLGFQGITFPAQDVSAHTKLRVDYFAGASSKLEFFLINTSQTGDPKEKKYVLDVTTAAKVGAWNNAIIDLSAYSDVVDLSAIDQIKIVGDGDVYLDNIYFFGSNAAPTTAPDAPTYDAASVTSVYSDAYTAAVAPNLNPGWGQATVASEKDLGGNKVLEYKGLDYQGTDFSSEALDVSAHTHFQFDYWTADASKFNFFVIGSGEAGYEVVPTALGQWNTVQVPLSFYDSAVDLTKVGQLKVDHATTGELATIYFDNMIFITEAE
jgi:hypothetical protein